MIVRGVGRQVLFEEDGDYFFFLIMLERYSLETGVAICAYCLMENHVHLLVQDTNGQVPLLMKKIEVCYAAFYNRKYDHCGHVFQGRYLSEPVDSEKYLLTVFRYILNNPKKAGISSAKEYIWSSYNEYARQDSFVDSSIFLDLIGNRESFERFIEIEEDICCMEHYNKKDAEYFKEKMQVLVTYSHHFRLRLDNMK